MTDIDPELSIELVDQFYEMDPKTEDLLFDGTLLKDGMVVLIEAPQMRMPLQFEDGPLSRDQMDVARVTNRWCEIVRVEVEPRAPFQISPTVSFVGKFGDGVRRKRNTPIDYAWIVKRYSNPLNG